MLVFHTVLIAALAALIFALIFFWHGATLVAPPVARAGHEIASAGSIVFSEGFVPQLNYIVRQFAFAPFLGVLLVLSPFLWRRRLRGRSEMAALAGLLLPLATVLFYRNSYPYYYVFVLAPAAVSIFPAMEYLEKRIGPLFCTFLFAGQAVLLTAREPADILGVQRDVDRLVHQIFPRPVPYIDFCGMIADYPRVYTFLTSGWGLQRYRLAQHPLLPAVMAGGGVPLLIANDPVIEGALRGANGPERFLSEDARLMRENFVQHWGPIWVAGKRIAPGQAARVFEMGTAGVYTLEGARIEIDGRVLGPGDTIHLTHGPHRIIPHPAREATLRWGDHLPRPTEPAPSGALFTIY